MSGFNAYQRGLLDGMRGNIPRNPYADKADRNSYYHGYEDGRQKQQRWNTEGGK